MKRMWSVEELHAHWSVSASERDLLFRREHVGRLGFIAQLAWLLQSKIDRPGGDYRFERIVRWTKYAFLSHPMRDLHEQFDEPVHEVGLARHAVEHQAERRAVEELLADVQSRVPAPAV